MPAVLLLPLLATLAAAQSCVYSAPAGPTIDVDGYISRLSMDGLTYSPQCPGKLGVDDQTANFRPTIRTEGTLSATFGTCSVPYRSSGELWVDWSNSGTFEKGVNSIGDWRGIPGSDAYSFRITVPAGTAIGPKRARIMMNEEAIPPLDPCIEFSYGAVIDFTLIVADPPVLPVVTHLDPESGPVGGGTRVAVRGTGFLSESGQRQTLRCAFGARLAAVHADWVFNDTVLCRTPAAPVTGFVPVRVLIETSETAVGRRLLSTAEAQKDDIFFEYT